MANQKRAIDQYLAQISKVPLLTAEEEKALAIRARSGDHAARQRLVESNLRFVVKVAKNYMNQGFPLLDLIQEGNVGLMEAIERYDPDRGFRLTTYAAWWIRLSIQRALEQKARVVSMPINKIEKLRKIKSFSHDFVNRTGNEPTVADISHGTGLDKKVINLLLKNETRVFSFDSPPNDDSVPMERVYASQVAPDPTEDVQREQLHEEVEDAMSVLSAKEKDVICRRFGLNGYEHGASLRQVGRSIGMSAEGVRRIEEQALNKLRRPHMQARFQAAV